MTNIPPHLPADLAPLISEDEIIHAVQSKSTENPSVKSYGVFPAEWVEDIEVIDLMMEMHNKYEGALMALRHEYAYLVAEVEQLRRRQRNL